MIDVHEKLLWKSPPPRPSTIDAGELVASLAMMVHELVAHRPALLATVGPNNVEDIDAIILDLAKAAHLVACTWAKPLVTT